MTSFTNLRLHKLPRFAPVVDSHLHVTSSSRRKSPFRDWIPFFNDNYAISDASDAFFYPDLLHLVYQDCPAPVGPVSIDCTPTRFLAAHGTVLANLWMEEMSRCRVDSFRQGETPIDDVGDILSFKSTSAFTLSSSIASLSDEVVESLLQLPLEKNILSPSANAFRHTLDPAHLLRTSRANTKSDSGDALDFDKVFQVLIDSGCSVSCTGFIEDFHGQIALGDFGHVNTADGNAKIEGFGILRWDTISQEGNRVVILVPGYYAPTVKMRLLSPQDYCRYHHFDSRKPQYMGSADWMSLKVKVGDNPSSKKAIVEEVLSHIDPSSRLPFLFCELGHHDSVNEKTARCHCHVTSIYDVRNFNLSDAQKRLKLDHDRLGHLSMQLIQKLYQPEDMTSPDFDGHPTSGLPCLIARDSAQLRCSPPLCEACEVARARKRPTGATRIKANPETLDSIRADDLSPGDCVSVDQYESSVRGRRLETKGRERWDYKFCGGTLFYDHASGKIFVNHQVTLSASETIRSKQAFEREAALCGFTIKKYRTDNGIFTSKAYEESLDDHQYQDRSAVGAHHQNGVAEANIGRVQRMARAMLLHLRLHWPDEFSADLWPFALDYAVYVYNHIPRKGKPGAPSPAEMFCGTKIGCRPLRRLKVFGCPTYVLDPRLQDGKKIPKWEPRSRKGQFLGFSSAHASTVGLVRNTRTGYISPQFHMVYDESFTTVTSDRSLDLSETWIELFLNSRDHYLDGHDESADGPLPELDPDFAPPRDPDPKFEDPFGQARQEDSRSQGEPLRQGEEPDRNPPVLRNVPTLVDSNHEPPDGSPSPLPNKSLSPPSSRDSESDVPAYEIEDSLPEPRQSRSRPERVTWHDVEVAPPRDSTSSPPSTTRQPEPSTPTSPLRPRRNVKAPERLTYEDRGQQATMLMPVTSNDFSHLRVSTSTSVLAYITLDWEAAATDPTCQYFDSLFRSQIDPETLELFDAQDAFHPFAFAAKVQAEDFPTYNEILRMDTSERLKWLEAMDTEMSDLVERQAFELVPRQQVLADNKKVVKSMWAFRKKRKPNGDVSRYKARLVVRGDLQKQFYDFTSNDTFAPVVEWSTVRMLFSLGVLNNWKTASIDFKSAFTQAHLPEPIYLELPPGYAKANPHLSDHVMKITTSLYGDQRAANLWYNKIRSSLETELGFTCSEYDPCLFIRKDCILCLYVDDAILHAHSDEVLEEVLQAIDKAGYAFSRDETFASYLGVLVEHLPDGTKKLSQPGLVRQLLDVMGMTDCNPARTPISGPLFAHKDSEHHDRGSFNYRSALGMLQYLTNNTRPEIAFATNASAQYSIDPRKPHSEAVRRICRYLKGTAEQGLIVAPSGSQLSLDCMVDADYAGNWNLPEAQDPETVKSRCGFVITLGTTPVLWKSKRIQEICLSTMESEYISLSMAMRSLIYLRGLLFEIDKTFDLGIGTKISTMSTVFEDNSAALILATTDPPRLTPRSKSLAIKYHWFRSKLSPTTIVIKAVSSESNTADIFTKALPFDAFARHRKTLCGW